MAMDPHTGEIRALVGGRNYGESQLNHALAHRQPGSAFKPFVYAAAFENAAQGMQPVVTPVTTVEDVPTTFDFDGKEYTPDNYGQEFYGTVTVRDALIHSLNVATVKVAEMIGYQRVVDVARQMGLGSNIQATPAVALGAYEMTPVDVAAGYTAFATNGLRSEPLFLRSVLAADGSVEESAAPRTRAVLDSARGIPGDQPDGGRHQSRHRRPSAHWDLRHRRQERPGLRAMVGLRDLLRISCASSGSGLTIIAIWDCRAAQRPPRSGADFMKRAVALPATATHSLSILPPA